MKYPGEGQNTADILAENNGFRQSAANSEAFAAPGQVSERVEIALELCKIVEEHEISLCDAMLTIVGYMGQSQAVWAGLCDALRSLPVSLRK